MRPVKKVALFVGGVQKAGTRSLGAFFRNHPEVRVQKNKEGHFFDRPENFVSEQPYQESLARYHAGFEGGASRQHLWCDITPDYIFRQGAIERIFRYNPDAKWIILLRHPIDRAYSAWNMEVNRGAEWLPFDRAIERELSGKTSPDRAHDRFCYVGRSRYQEQLNRLWRYFPEHQCCILPAENVWKNPGKHLEKVCDFAGIPPGEFTNYRQLHQGKYEQPMASQTRDWLTRLLHWEIFSLPQRVGWQENPWLQ